MKLKSHRGSRSNIYSQSCSSPGLVPWRWRRAAVDKGRRHTVLSGGCPEVPGGAVWCLTLSHGMLPQVWRVGRGTLATAARRSGWEEMPSGWVLWKPTASFLRGGRSLQLVGDGRTESKDLGGKGRKSCFPAGLGEKLSFIFLFNCKIPPWCFALQLVWASECGKLAWGVPLVTLLEMVFGFSFLRAT